MYNPYRYYRYPNGGDSRFDEDYKTYPYTYEHNTQMSNSSLVFEDYGAKPFVVNIDDATKLNNAFRRALWTGKHLQLTLMSIDVGEEIGLEVHPELDQFIRIEDGQGLVLMGDNKYNMDFKIKVFDDFAFIIPAGIWHNLINTGNVPIKLYSIYTPPEHPHGTVHQTRAIAEEAEKDHAY